MPFKLQRAYGKDRLFPVSELGKQLCRLQDRETLSPEARAFIEAVGFTVEIVT